MEAMDVGDKEDSSTATKHVVAEDGGGKELGGVAAADGALATNSSNLTTKTQQQQQNKVPAAPANLNNTDDCEMETDNDKVENSQNAGIHKDELNTNNSLSPNKATTIVEDSRTNNDKSMALTLTPSTTEEPSQSPTTSIGGGCGVGGTGTDSDGKMQSPNLTSPAASTPASTPPSETGQGDGGGGYSPPDITGNSSAEHSSPTADVADQTSMDAQKHPSQQSPTQIQPPTPPIHHPHAINVVRNGTIPNAGKPLMSTISKKFEKSAKSGRTRKPKAAAGPMYESEVRKNIKKVNVIFGIYLKSLVWFRGVKTNDILHCSDVN